jgi:hypothetical protein
MGGQLTGSLSWIPGSSDRERFRALALPAKLHGAPQARGLEAGDGKGWRWGPMVAQACMISRPAHKERLPVPWRLDGVDAMACPAGLLQKMMAGCDMVGMCSSPGYTGMGWRLKLGQQRKHMGRPLRA